MNLLMQYDNERLRDNEVATEIFDSSLFLPS